MDPNKDIAEEQLLRVIEGGRAAPAAKLMHRNSPRMPWFKKNGNRLENFGSAFNTKNMQFGLPLLNAVMWVVLAALGMYLIVDFLFFQYRGRMQYTPVAISAKSPENASQDSIEAPPQVKPLSEFSKPLSDRNPFTGSQASSEKKEEVVQRPVEDFSKLADGLSVVGINRGPPPEAFIEDTVQKRTYFVKVGDPVKNMNVKEIKDGSVILNYKDQEVVIA